MNKEEKIAKHTEKYNSKDWIEERSNDLRNQLYSKMKDAYKAGFFKFYYEVESDWDNPNKFADESFDEWFERKDNKI